MLYVNPKFQAFDHNGDPLTGGKLYTYLAGTTTPKTTYSDVELETANSNPIVLDSRGEAVPIFGFGWYKFVLKDANDVLIWTFDDIWGIGCCSVIYPFDSDDLDSGVLIIEHGYGQKYMQVDVFNDAGIRVIPDYVDCSDPDQIEIGFSDITVSGTWNVRYGI